MWLLFLRPRVKGRNIVVCFWMPRVASVYTLCWMLWRVVGSCCTKFKASQTFEPTTPIISFVPSQRSVAQQCCIRLHNSSNIVGTTHAHYTWSPKSYGLYPSQNAMQVPALLEVVAPVCTWLYIYKAPWDCSCSMEKFRSYCPYYFYCYSFNWKPRFVIRLKFLKVISLYWSL